MRSKRLTAEESHEMAVLVNEIGVKQVLELLRAHQRQGLMFEVSEKKAKHTKVKKWMRWPHDLRASFAYMLYCQEYSQKQIFEYVNNEIERRGLPKDLRVSRTALNGYIIEIEKSIGRR